MTYYTIKSPDGVLLPLWMGVTQEAAVENCIGSNPLDILKSFQWRQKLANGYSVVPVRVTLEEIKP